jgi:hypothetical protein
MTTRKLDKKQWREFFDGISKLLEGKQAEIEDERKAPIRYCPTRAREAVPIFRMTFPSQTAGEYVERR